MVEVGRKNAVPFGAARALELVSVCQMDKGREILVQIVDVCESVEHSKLGALGRYDVEDYKVELSQPRSTHSTHLLRETAD
jgi:hypothetical protein